MRVQLSNGVMQDLDGLAASFTYDGSGNMTAQTWTDGAWTWVRTFTYNGSNVLTSQTAVARAT